MIVANTVHAQFLARATGDSVEETQAVTIARGRELIGMPAGNSVLDYRDRAILKFYLYSAARLASGCQAQVNDFYQDENGATIRLIEKGDRRRQIGLHFTAAQAISEYIDRAGLTSGPLFRPRASSRGEKLADRPISTVSMYRLIQSYLERLPGSMKEVRLADGRTFSRCLYTPHSLRATAATLLLDAGVEIVKVQELLGHKRVSTTQIYDKRRRSVHEGASHEMPI